ncbi:uncharacterized protein LOC143252658 [Tachypleus tridentatus]|uniref:uncharacterized protein LOC143252658 n=1 Tax=Tachypleus tridentatus TaxID=6853 RepID=UPI003FD0B3B4
MAVVKVTSYLLTILTSASILVFFHFSNGRRITCICTTSQCQLEHHSTCNTSSVCYTQFLDRKDGSSPLVRGCIITKTPLLCENRRPAIVSNWPILMCCSTNFCNEETLPTSTAWIMSKLPNTSIKVSSIQVNTTRFLASSSEDQKLKNRERQEVGNSILDSSATSDATPNSRSRVFNPVFVGMLTLGMFCVYVIGFAGIFIYRRYDQVLGDDLRTTQCFHYDNPLHQATREDLQEIPLSRDANSVFDNNVIQDT